MYTIEHEFYPGDEVFVVLNEETIKRGSVIQVTANVYGAEDNIIEVLEYLVLLDNLETVDILPYEIFSTYDEASVYIEQNI